MKLRVYHVVSSMQRTLFDHCLQMLLSINVLKCLYVYALKQYALR